MGQGHGQLLPPAPPSGSTICPDSGQIVALECATQTPLNTYPAEAGGDWPPRMRMGRPFRLCYFTNCDILKIGRMMLIAMKPTMKPITTIISGSIMAVTVLMTFRSSLP